MCYSLCMNAYTLKTLLFVSLVANAVFAYMLYDVRHAVAPTEDTSTEKTVVDTVPSEQTYESGKLYPFLRVVDGDTIVVGFEGTMQYVRLIGINAPEINIPGGPQCYGEEATEHLQRIARTGLVRLVFDESQGMRDMYGRLLAYVELEDGTDLGLQMIADGYAHEYTFNEPYERDALYKEAQRTASEEGRGLWGEGVCPK